VPLHKSCKISPNQEYPCPCRHEARLLPIVLTEAFGCDRCQQIFVAQLEAGVIEQLAAVSTPRFWRWNGSRWLPFHQDAGTSRQWVGRLSLVLLGLALCLALSPQMLWGAIVMITLVMLPALMFLLTYRRP
jgi:hypothetical protein